MQNTTTTTRDGHEITVTTKNVTRGGDEFTITIYTVGGYDLIRDSSPGRDHDRWSPRSPYGLPSIEDRSIIMSKTPEFGVNWSARGAQSSTDARAYGALVMAAADVADVFNSIAASS